jgi:hypothetical protein
MSSGEKRASNTSWRATHERFVVTVDGQTKSSFASAEDAQREADRIASGHPKVVVHVLDGTRHLVREYPDKADAGSVPDDSET